MLLRSITCEYLTCLFLPFHLGSLLHHTLFSLPLLFPLLSFTLSPPLCISSILHSSLYQIYRSTLQFISTILELISFHLSRAYLNYFNLTAVPATSHSCSTDMVQGYFRGKSASCTCRLTPGGSGNPRGTAGWYQGDAVQIVESDGSLSVTYQPNSE